LWSIAEVKKKEMVNKIVAKVIVEAYIISSDSLMLPDFYVNPRTSAKQTLLTT